MLKKGKTALKNYEWNFKKYLGVQKRGPELKYKLLKKGGVEKRGPPGVVIEENCIFDLPAAISVKLTK